MEDDEIEQQDDFPLRWSEWAWIMPILAVFVIAAWVAERRKPEGDDMDNRQGY